MRNMKTKGREGEGGRGRDAKLKYYKFTKNCSSKNPKILYIKASNGHKTQ